MEADDVGRLVEGLAAVAIAGLVVNPVAAAGAAAAVPFVSSRLKRNVQTRNESRRISAAVAAWAKGENLGDDLGAGLAIATETMWRHGLIANEFKDLDYDADRGTEEIIRSARRKDPYSWAATSYGGEDAGHVVARRAIRATLAAIASSHHEIETTWLCLIPQRWSVPKPAPECWPPYQLPNPVPLVN